MNKYIDTYTKFVEDIISKKYFIGNDKTWEDVAKRVAFSISRNKDTARKLYDLIVEKKLLPGGRILYCADNPAKVTCLNCYTINPNEDSIQGIYEWLAEIARTYSYGGGAGSNISILRPRGYKVNNAAKTSTGAVSFLRALNVTGDTIGQNNRRAAQIAILNVDHPDIEEFIRMKSEPYETFAVNIVNAIDKAEIDDSIKEYIKKLAIDQQINRINLSVFATDEFMKAVENDDDWELKFDGIHGTVVKKVKARYLFDLIAQKAWESGEPGMLFIDTARATHNGEHIPGHELAGTNPCLHEDTILFDSDRMKKISEKEGALWYSWPTGEKRVLKIETNTGHELMLTEDHLIETETGIFVEASNILGRVLKYKVGNWGKPAFYLDSYVLSGFLFRKGTYNNGFVEVKVDSVKQRNMIPILEKYGFEKRAYRGSKYKYRIRYSELPVTAYFVREKIGYRRIPESILFDTKEILASFIRGITEASGNVDMGHIIIPMKNKKNAQDIQLALNAFGIYTSIYHRKAKYPRWEVRISKYSTLDFINKIGFLTPYRYDRVESSDKNSIVMKVIRVRDMGKQPVWDFAMRKPPHINTANGISVHNCSELFLPNYGSCNLSSINLKKFVTKEGIDWESLRDAVRIGVEFLDDVVDYNKKRHPLKKQSVIHQEDRRIGLGVMGLADVFLIMGIRYDSEEASEIAEKIFKFIAIEAYKKSIELAKERGAFPKWDSEYHSRENFFTTRILPNLPEEYVDMYMKHGIRNVELMAIAPTGTISIVAETTSSIEPLYSPWYTRWSESLGKSQRIVHPTLFEVYPHLKDIEDWDILRKEIDKLDISTAHNIDPIKKIKMIGKIQYWTDGSISQTVNLPHSSTVDDVKNIFLEAWKNKLKGITIYRDGSRTMAVLETTETHKPVSNDKKYDAETNTDKKSNEWSIVPQRPTVLHAVTYKIKYLGENYYVTISYNENKFPVEIFVNTRDQHCADLLHTLARAVSSTLRRLAITNEDYDFVIEDLKATMTVEGANNIWKGFRIPSKGAILGVALEWFRNNTDPDREIEEKKKSISSIGLFLSADNSSDRAENSHVIECPECKRATEVPSYITEFNCDFPCPYCGYTGGKCSG